MSYFKTVALLYFIFRVQTIVKFGAIALFRKWGGGEAGYESAIENSRGFIPASVLLNFSGDLKNFKHIF